MSFLLDTNVVSEWVRPQPNAGLMRWTDAVDEDSVFLSVITLAELRHGIDRMVKSKRRRRLEAWLHDELPIRFEGRILSIDPSVADACGRMIRRAELLGRPIEAMDAFLAATAEIHDLTLVTRNVSDFPLFKTIVNPWT